MDFGAIGIRRRNDSGGILYPCLAWDLPRKRTIIRRSLRSHERCGVYAIWLPYLWQIGDFGARSGCVRFFESTALICPIRRSNALLNSRRAVFLVRARRSARPLPSSYQQPGAPF